MESDEVRWNIVIVEAVVELLGRSRQSSFEGEGGRQVVAPV